MEMNDNNKERTLLENFKIIGDGEEYEMNIDFNENKIRRISSTNNNEKNLNLYEIDFQKKESKIINFNDNNNNIYCYKQKEQNMLNPEILTVIKQINIYINTPKKHVTNTYIINNYTIIFNYTSNNELISFNIILSNKLYKFIPIPFSNIFLTLKNYSGSDCQDISELNNNILNEPIDSSNFLLNKELSLSFQWCGNWCGPGYGGFNNEKCSSICFSDLNKNNFEECEKCHPPINSIDKVCMIHDFCIQTSKEDLNFGNDCGNNIINYPCHCHQNMVKELKKIKADFFFFRGMQFNEKKYDGNFL